MKKAPLLLALCGSAILLATGAFHATGYVSIREQIEASSATPFLEKAVPTLWLFFSWHLLTIAGGALGAASTMRSAARPVLFVCALIVAIDFFWVHFLAGVFAGTLLLLAAAACLLIAACLTPRVAS